jgi:hypothetical protein
MPDVIGRMERWTNRPLSNTRIGEAISSKLKVAGATGEHSPQTEMALKAFRGDESVTALYGFSGGG